MTSNPYQLSQALRSLSRFGPTLLEHGDVVLDALWGRGRLPPKSRYAIHLRLARLSRSPLALLVFPALARVIGLDSGEIDAALAGDFEKLDQVTARVAAWASAVAEAGGEMPIEWPDAARELTMRERERVLLLTRLEMVIYTLSLVPVPKFLLGADPKDLAEG